MEIHRSMRTTTGRSREKPGNRCSLNSLKDTPYWEAVAAIEVKRQIHRIAESDPEGVHVTTVVSGRPKHAIWLKSPDPNTTWSVG